MSTQTGSGPQMTEDYHEQLGKLLLLLELEQEALKNRQFDTIDSCTKDKEEALRQLELLEQKRLQFIQNQGGRIVLKHTLKLMNRLLSCSVVAVNSIQ